MILICFSSFLTFGVVTCKPLQSNLLFVRSIEFADTKNFL